MRKLYVLGMAAPTLLIGAAYPLTSNYVAAIGDQVSLTPAAGPITYRPCRPGYGDDRCIQLYERGVRASYARWLRRHGRSQQAAVGGPVERPARHSTTHTVRCVDEHGHEAAPRGM
ncbi:MAG: hypothetical protein ACT4OE_09130 [Sphingosinicella sp.]